MSIRQVLLAALTVTVAAGSPGVHAQTPTLWLTAYREPAARLIGEALSDTFAWRRLAELTDTFGHRLSGTPQLERAILWAAEEMKRDGLENVHTERVMVPRWVRGRESAEIVEPARHAIVMLGLGDSVGTPPDGIQADVLIVRSFAELDARSAQMKGRIVLINAPFTTYEDGRARRVTAPSRCSSDRLALPGCGCRTPEPCSTAATRHGFRRPPSRPKMPIACSAWRIAAVTSSSGCGWARTSSPTSSPPMWSASCGGASGPTSSS